MKLDENKSTVYNQLLTAEANFLSGFGWKRTIPIVLGAPMFWKDPIENCECSQDFAVTTQKSRVISILYR